MKVEFTRVNENWQYRLEDGPDEPREGTNLSLLMEQLANEIRDLIFS